MRNALQSYATSGNRVPLVAGPAYASAYAFALTREKPMYETYPHPPTPRTPQQTLSIQVSRFSQDYELQDEDGYVHAKIALGTLAQGPDPIQRAWSHLEAKRGMAALQDTPATPRPCTPEKPKGLLGWVRSLGNPRIDPGASCAVRR